MYRSPSPIRMMVSGRLPMHMMSHSLNGLVGALARSKTGKLGNGAIEPMLDPS